MNGTTQWAPAPLIRLAAYAMNILRNKFHPLRNPRSPLVQFSNRKVEEYYARTLTDRSIADTWRARYFGALGLPKAPRLFDHGCGRGRFSALAANSGFAVVGQDVEPQTWWANLKGQFKAVPAERRDLPWPANHFDAAFDCGVIGHLPPAALQALFHEMRRVIKPGGVWVIQEANSRGYGARVTRRYYGRFYSIEDAIALAESSGFTVIDHWFEGVQSPIFPVETNWIFNVALPKQINMDAETTLDKFIPERKRRLWVLRLRRT